MLIDNLLSLIVHWVKVAVYTVDSDTADSGTLELGVMNSGV